MRTKRKNRQVLIGLLVVVVAIVGLVHFGLSSSEIYSLKPAELLEAGEEFSGRDIRLIGIVVDGSIDRDLLNTRTDFRVVANAQEESAAAVEDAVEPEVPVTYIGTVVPDTFTDGAEVVVLGTYDGSTFRATRIMTKCPSKYDTDPEYSDRKIA